VELDVHLSCSAQQGLGGLDNDCHVGEDQQLWDKNSSFIDFDWRTGISQHSRDRS